MTIVDLWQYTLQYGALFLLFVGVILFFNGKLVSGDLSRQAHEREMNALASAHKNAMEAFKQRYDEMQATWRERLNDAVQERDTFRVLAMTLARQAEQGISAAEVLTRTTLEPRGRPKGRDPT